MPFLELIEHDGHVAAVVAGGRAIIAEHLPKRARRPVAAKCLYALGIEAGDRPGPYRDEDAERYAETATPARRGFSRRGPALEGGARPPPARRGGR